MELNRGDGSLGTFLGVQAGLAMRSIAMLGSEEHQQRWLPEMARIQKLGAFALTEPEHGSDSIALESTARRERDDYVIDGRKRFISNAGVADFYTVFARTGKREDGRAEISAFIVSARMPGFSVAERTEMIAPHPIGEEHPADYACDEVRRGGAVASRAGKRIGGAAVCAGTREYVALHHGTH